MAPPGGFDRLSGASALYPLTYAVTLLVAYAISTAIYNLFFHPLSRFPGPKLYAISRLPYAIDLARGDLVKTVTRLHEQYGDVVRVAPGELSFISGETAWADIYGFRGGKSEELSKDLDWYLPAPNGTRSLLSASRENHSRFRRVFSHAFSDHALRKQEPLVQRYVDMLIERLREHAGQAVDMVRYYNFTTFDIIGDLTFNESFGCLESDDYHSLVEGAFASVRAISFRLAIHYYKLAERLYFALRPNGIQKGSMVFFDFTAAKVDKRLNTDTTRPDFITFVERQANSTSLRDEELKANCFLFLIAGSETTATALSGATYLLLKHPEALAKLTAEVRGQFKSSDEITFEAAGKLPYLQAVANEGLRLYPPVPTGFPRAAPPGGATVSGRFIPEKTAIYVSQYPAYRSKRNFASPNSFIPERWLTGEDEDPRFANDKKSVLMPFSSGPRNCLGKNLAHAEFRVILAKILFNFDMALVDDRTDWLDQKCFNLWEKSPLNVSIKLAET